MSRHTADKDHVNLLKRVDFHKNMHVFTLNPGKWIQYPPNNCSTVTLERWLKEPIALDIICYSNGWVSHYLMMFHPLFLGSKLYIAYCKITMSINSVAC